MINGNKSKCIVINSNDKYQFSPRLFLDGQQLKVVDSASLLGTIIYSDLRWEHHTN